MALVLDDLLNDDRLARLFSQEGRPCALQLWILEIKSDKPIENRVVYGRLLPYNHSTNSWHFSDNNDFSTIGKVKAKVARLNLYVDSVRCADLLRQLSAGRAIDAISKELKLKLPEKLKAQFGAITLAADNLIYRPVAYLLNRDGHDHHMLSSPHGGAGAFSASITQTNKGMLFHLNQDYDVALTTWVVKQLDEDTGLDFGSADTSRFGDLELLVFPALDDHERRLLDVSWTDAPRTLVVRFNPMQLPHFSGFQFRLNIENNSQIIYSSIATAERGAGNVFEYKFELNDQLRATTDSTELELFGFHDNNSREGTLCCRWRVSYVREISLQGHMVGHRTSAVKFDWLERATRPSMSDRVRAALTLNSGDLGFNNRIGGREADPWVPVNRDLIALFSRLHPPKSDGRFFLRWGQDDGEGRLQFVEWFKAILAKYQQHQVVIFDPYFESAGLGLMLLYAVPKADYIIFRSLPKQKESEPSPGKCDKPTSNGIDNLVAGCEHNRHRLGRIKLRIYGLKDGRLHDRYILVIGPDKLPIAGFNLSNSFQKAAENYPLLVTPIPADTLLKVEQYQSGLMQEAKKAARPEDEAENPAMRLLFDSTASPTVPRRYEPLRFLEKAQTGDVLSVWVGDPSLQGLNSALLKERMTAQNLLKDNSLTLPETTGLRNFLDKQAGDFADFTSTWDVLGEVLAHSHTENRHFRELKSEHSFLEFLLRFLNSSFNRAHEDRDKELAVVDAQLFRKPVEALLHSPYRMDHLFHATKYAALTWAEYYTIRFLWWYAPDALLTATEAQVASLSIEPQESDVMRLSLLSQIISEISLAVQFDINEEQRDRLVRSDNGLLKWMGLNAIEKQLEKPEGLATVLQLLAPFSYPERIRTLGWMTHHAAKSPKTAEIYKGLVAALMDELPAKIPADELRYLVDSMRGHMQQLTWAGTWLFQDVVVPLLENNRADTDDACEIWVLELIALLKPKNQPLLFERVREGQTTNMAAFLFAYSTPERQQVSLKLMQEILKQQRQIVQRPLASTSDWARWDTALVISMWILIFTRWGQYYLRQRDLISQELEQLSRDAHHLAMIRPMDEWQSERPGKQGELAEFLDLVENLLIPTDVSKGEDK